MPRSSLGVTFYASRVLLWPACWLSTRNSDTGGIIKPGGVATTPARARVALAQATSYDRGLVRRQVRALLAGLGGLDNVVSSGDRVAIKVNLTGGVKVKPLPGVSPIESYVTHPEVVRALGEAVREAGVRELFIVEAVYEWESYRLWGYEAHRSLIL